MPEKRYRELFTVIIPVWNSAAYIDIILRHYSRLGIAPLLIIDSKTSDNTIAVASQFDCQTCIVENPTKRSQHIIEPGARRVETPWALKVDDDELPNRRLIEYIAEIVPRLSPRSTVGFVRHQCTLRAGRLWSSTIHGAELHRQFRLFQPSRVKYTKQAHTPGFQTPARNWVIAPSDAAMVHLDWIVHTPEERDQKLARYDEHTPNSGSNWREYYLADCLDPAFESHIEPLPIAGFEQLEKDLTIRYEQPKQIVGLNSRASNS